MPVTIPPRLLEILGGSPFEAKTLGFARACEEILDDNKMPFFPAYTDHGAAHVQALFDAAERLIPDQVWDEGLLEPADAAVLVGAAFAHDLALHMREAGFSALVAGSSALTPLHWFDEDRPSRAADLPWPELWQGFRKEARRLSQSQLDRLFGPQKAEVPPIAFGDADPDPGGWTAGDRLLIGEFIRRHHARLSHEIAIHGFPGVGDEFPVLAQSMPELADAIGVTSRSHNEELRTMTEYLEYAQPGDRRPDGAVLTYLMGVLRIADYFQIEASRAPTLLLHLREPQSPQSVAEWKKHRAVQRISWTNTDPMAVNVQVSPDHELRTHLQLAELIESLQAELDVTSAVLGEAYGRTDLAPLRLSRQRVRTNLFERSLHEKLGFVPKRARLRSAEDLFRLVIADLYGNEPVVAGRELLQNAVDAVRELEHFKERTGAALDGADFHEIPTDVLVEHRQLDEERSVLRVLDRGIGMTPATVIESFLTAGASFSKAQADLDGVDPATAIRWMKAGRFGVGVFASFLLGTEVHVTTRHVESRRGVRFVARLDDDLVQLDWVDDAPIGTEVSVPFPYSVILEGSERARYFGPSAQNFLHEIADYYRLSSPTATYREVDLDGGISEFWGAGDIPTSTSETPGPWRTVSAPGFDAVMWRHSIPDVIEGNSWGFGAVTHNGIVIRKPYERGDEDTYQWADKTAMDSLQRPDIAIFDRRQLLGVTLNRYELTESTLPFESELLSSVGADIVAQALVRGETRHPLAKGWALEPVAGGQHWLPLLPRLLDEYIEGDLCVLWASRTAQRQALAESFRTDQATDTSWQELPFRVVLSPLRRMITNLKEEYELWGMTHNEVSHSVRALASMTGRELVAGVSFRSRSTMIQFSGRSADPDHAWQNAPSRGRFERFDMQSAIEATPSETDALASVGANLMEKLERGSIALALLRRTLNATPGPYRKDPLAERWISTLGGPLEHDEEARHERMASLVQNDEELGALVRPWVENPDPP